MKIITLASWKGGTGKTTLTAAIMKALALQGYKILGIDFDDNLTMTKMFNVNSLGKTSLDFIYDSIFEPVEVFENMFFIPSDKRNQTLSNVPERKINSILKKVDISIYDFIFLDTPGEINALTRSAVIASDLILIPTMPSSLDEGSIENTLKELEMMEIDADVYIVLNGFDPKRNIEGITELLQEKYGEFFYPHPISAMKSLKNLTANISTYKLQGRSKEIINQFIHEVIL